MSDEWQTLAQTWQSQKIDLPQLKRSTRWKTWRMIANGALEFLMVFYVWGITWFLWDKVSDSAVWLSWLLMWCIVAPICFVFSFKAKRGLWRTDDQTVVGLLKLKWRRLDWAVKGARIATIFFLISLLLSVLWGVASMILEPAPADEPWYRLWIAVASTSVWLLGASMVSVWYRRRQARELKNVERLLAELEQ